MGQPGGILLVSRAEGCAKKRLEAAVEAAKGYGVPPPELALAWKCERWHALPEAGGVMDQDWKLMRNMAILSNIYNTVDRLGNLQGAEIHSLTTSERRILQWLMDEGIVING